MPSCRRFSRPSEHLGSSSAIASTSDVCAGSGRSLTGQSRRVMWSSVSLATGVPRTEHDGQGFVGRVVPHPKGNLGPRVSLAPK
jgi:hypothetical protein